jgi:ribosomal protein L24E
MITFSDIQFPYLKANCQHCGVTTIFKGHQRYRVDNDASVLIIPEYQCQNCGKLTFAMPDNPINENILDQLCKCGGQYRKDRPLFCNSCHNNKTDLNISDS